MTIQKFIVYTLKKFFEYAAYVDELLYCPCMVILLHSEMAPHDYAEQAAHQMHK